MAAALEFSSGLCTALPPNFSRFYSNPLDTKNDHPRRCPFTFANPLEILNHYLDFGFSYVVISAELKVVSELDPAIADLWRNGQPPKCFTWGGLNSPNGPSEANHVLPISPNELILPHFRLQPRAGLNVNQVSQP